MQLILQKVIAAIIIQNQGFGTIMVRLEISSGIRQDIISTHWLFSFFHLAYIASGSDLESILGMISHV